MSETNTVVLRRAIYGESILFRAPNLYSSSQDMQHHLKTTPRRRLRYPNAAPRISCWQRVFHAPLLAKHYPVFGRLVTITDRLIRVVDFARRLASPVVLVQVLIEIG